MTRNDENGSLRDQLESVAREAFPVPERADVMAKALFSLQFAEQWLAELVEDSTVAMRGADDQFRRRYTSTGRDIELVVELGVELRITGAVEPPSQGWAVVRAGSHRELIRMDDDGMFTALVPVDAGPVDLALEFDDGVTMTMKGIADQAP